MAMPLIEFEDTGRDVNMKKMNSIFLFVKFKISIDIQKAFGNMAL